MASQIRAHRKGRVAASLPFVVLGALLGALLAASTLLSRSAEVRFGAGADGMASARVRCPPGYYYVDYVVYPDADGALAPLIGSRGVARCRLFGWSRNDSNMYPAEGRVRVAPGEPVLLQIWPASEPRPLGVEWHGDIEVFGLLTRDPDTYDRLEELERARRDAGAPSR